MVQGGKYLWFVDNYFEPFLKQRISNSMDRIKKINQNILSKLQPNSKKSKKVENTLDESTEAIACEKCDFICKTATELRKHITNVHSNLFEGFTIQATKQIETQIDEAETCDQCKFTTHDSDKLRQHIVNIHTSNSSPVYHKCDKCTYSKSKEEDMNNHKHLHIAEVLSGFLHQCQECDYFN